MVIKVGLIYKSHTELRSFQNLRFIYDELVKEGRI